jgi:hypothetical protein
MQPLRSTVFAWGSELYELTDEYDGEVTGFTGVVEYYGYVNNRCMWIIQEHNISNGTWRFANGFNSYPAAWTGKGGLSYAYLYLLSGTTP